MLHTRLFSLFFLQWTTNASPEAFQKVRDPLVTVQAQAFIFLFLFLGFYFTVRICFFFLARVSIDSSSFSSFLFFLCCPSDSFQRKPFPPLFFIMPASSCILLHANAKECNFSDGTASLDVKENLSSLKVKKS